MAEATAREAPLSGIFPQASTAVSARLSVAIALAIVAVATFAVQASVLGHYFFGDDFVPLADIATRGTGEYVKDLFLMQEETPNWRFLTGLFYLGAYETFGLDAMPFLLVAVLVHAATAGLIFYFIHRVTDDVLTAGIAALFFGLTPASVPTVGQVTAINNVFGAFFLMLSVVLAYEAFDRRHTSLWLAGSAVAFAAAIASNDPVALLAPAPALAAVLSWSKGHDWRAGVRQLWPLVLAAVPFALIGGAAIAAYAACDCVSAADGSRYGLGVHMLDNLWLFLGRLLYPVGIEAFGDLNTSHQVAGPVLAGVAVVMLVRGPAVARFAVAFLILALLPPLPMKLWSAPRYVYLATIPFSMLAGLAIAEVARTTRSLSPLMPALVTCIAAGVLGLYSWQTISQNGEFGDQTDKWKTFVTGVEEVYPELPPGSSVYVYGGPLWDQPLLQCAVLPAAGDVIWGDANIYFLYDLGAKARPGYDVYFIDATEEPYHDVPVGVAQPGERVNTLLPQVAPGTRGNLCLDDVPRLP